MSVCFVRLWGVIRRLVETRAQPQPQRQQIYRSIAQPSPTFYSREMETCPYSQLPYGEFSDDHIFPRFLGGSRTIRVCGQCNNIFGHTFEGRASNQLKRLQVFISDFGLDLTRTTAAWPAAIVIDKITYDLQSGPEGAQYVLHKPTFIKDSEGNIVGGKARSLSEARQITSGLKTAGKIKDAEIFYGEDEPFEGVNLTSALTFNDDLYRLATKMVGAALVAFDRAHVAAESGYSRLPPWGRIYARLAGILRYRAHQELETTAVPRRLYRTWQGELRNRPDIRISQNLCSVALREGSSGIPGQSRSDER